MLIPVYRNHFEKEVKRSKKRGKDMEKLKTILRKLVNEEPLARKHCDHALTGNYRGRRECHIEPDWLLIYKIDGEEIIFERTGTHSDLFR